MEPVTHFMTGAVMARAGLNRKAAYATLAMTLAAEAPDLDTIWGWWGPVVGFQHHRGWTHSFVGIPLEAAVVVGAVWCVHRWRKKEPAAPVRWGLLWCFSMVAMLSHILLDWTNNYGVRPLWPFNTRWYDGSFVFIAEPMLWVLLLGALILPSLFGLVGGEIGAKKEVFRGRSLAWFALLGIMSLWGLRWYEHGRAEQIAQANEIEAQVIRVAAEPHPINPFAWHVIIETPMFYRVGSVNTLRSEMVSDSATDKIQKPPTTLATLKAKRTLLGEVFLDWAKFPIVQEVGYSSDKPVGQMREVTFTDLRFGYDVLGQEMSKKNPLGGTVFLDENGRVVQVEMSGKEQK